MTKHTPGPWFRNVPPATKYVTIFNGPNGKHGHVVDVIPCRGVPLEQAEANLSLIADAPAMLATLAKLCAVFDLDEHDQDRAHAEACAIAEARTLVAKHMEPNQ
jgi:hypothetical protein